MPMVVLMIRMIAGRVIVIMMRMIVIMVMRVVMAMTLLAADSVPVSMVMALGGAAFAVHVSPTFGIERRLERDHPSPEPFGHRLDHGIAADAQRLRQHFGQEVAVAKVPGDAGHRQRVRSPDLRQRFGLGDHFHHASILKSQPVAATQHGRFREIEQEFESTHAGHGDPPAVAPVEIEHHRVCRSARPTAGRDDFVSAQHLYTFRLGRPRSWESRAAWTEFEREAKQTPAGL
jgi:hypothetical protein